VADKAFIKFTFGIFLISLASLTFEVALSYEYAFMFWFAVSFIVITIAMFGLGIGSVLGYFHFKRKPESYRESLYSSSIALGLAMTLALAVTAFLSKSGPISEATGHGFDPKYGLGILAILAAAVVPFVFSGFILSMGLSYPSENRRRISYIYFADLIGAGIGSFLITAFLPFTGVEKVILVYRRTRKYAPAGEREFNALEEKGVEVRELTQPIEYLGEGGRVRAIKAVKMKLEASGKGRPKPVPLPGSEHLIRVSAVIEATGLQPTPPPNVESYGVKLNPDGTVKTDDRYRTTRKGVFAAGDVKHGASLIGPALKSGVEAARFIDEYLTTGRW
jgi:hypothetical protein